jgi:23S rRNA (cytidine1920-2'-O)/16S rRNA (cytidine1409-2'-O)-methyltransferase
MKHRQRLDLILVERGLVDSREKGQALILAGEVTVDGQKVDKPGHAVEPDSKIELAEQPRYVGRGGLKLEAALDHFGIPVKGKVCLDVGSSTGGFTDCLLMRGARRVCCVDVGYGQLHERLRADPRVTVRERLNARYLLRDQVPFAPNLVVADVSFISLTAILEAVLGVARRPWRALVLVKPQFEAGRDRVGRGGVVHDPGIRAAAVARIARYALSLDATPLGAIDTGLPGPAGNHEYLLALASTDHDLARSRPRPDPDQIGGDAVSAATG